MQVSLTYGVCGLCHSDVVFGRFYGQTISPIPRIWGKKQIKDKLFLKRNAVSHFIFMFSYILYTLVR